MRILLLTITTAVVCIGIPVALAAWTSTQPAIDKSTPYKGV